MKKVLFAIGLVLGTCVLFALPTMILWNWLMPEIFVGVKPITFLQAVGLNALSNILFKPFSNSK